MPLTWAEAFVAEITDTLVLRAFAAAAPDARGTVDRDEVRDLMVLFFGLSAPAAERAVARCLVLAV